VSFGLDDAAVLVLGEVVGSLQPNQPGVLHVCEDDVEVGIVVVVVVVVVAVIVTVGVFFFVSLVA